MQRRTKLSHDMSIEEMLKSIRGIINTHQKSKPKDDEDILELTEIVAHTIVDDTEFGDKHEGLKSTPALDIQLNNNITNFKNVDYKRRGDSHNINNINEDLISSSVINESIANIKNLTKHAKDSLDIEKKLSAEELLIQLLKPQLKEWLDKNLPQLIEQMLEKEIRKLVPKNKEF